MKNYKMGAYKFPTKTKRNYNRKNQFNKTYRKGKTKRTKATELTIRNFLITGTIAMYLFAGAYHIATATRTITIENNGGAMEELDNCSEASSFVEFQGEAVVSSSNCLSLGVKEVSAYSELDSCHYPTKGGCLTASGKIAKVGMVATNLHPFGTKLRIGNEIYIVEDRISKRYKHRYDLFMGMGEEAHRQALNFGIQYFEVEILDN